MSSTKEKILGALFSFIFGAVFFAIGQGEIKASKEDPNYYEKTESSYSSSFDDDESGIYLEGEAGSYLFMVLGVIFMFINPIYVLSEQTIKPSRNL